MRRGDFLLTPGWAFHGHHNETDHPMAWIDGLDIPFVKLHRHRVLRVRGRRRDRHVDAGHLTLGTTLGASGCVRWSASTRGSVRPSRATAGSTPMLRCVSNLRSRTRVTRHDRTRPRRRAVHQPDHGQRRDADDPGRIPPSAPGCCDPHPSGRRRHGLPGVRGRGLFPARGPGSRCRERRHDRRSVVGAVEPRNRRRHRSLRLLGRSDRGAPALSSHPKSPKEPDPMRSPHSAPTAVPRPSASIPIPPRQSSTVTRICRLC